MKYLMVIIFVTLCSVSYASDKGSVVSINSLEEMYKLVGANSDSRTYLWCSIVSGKLGMEDVRQLFVRKAGAFSSDSSGFLMAHAYMTGFIDNELLNLESEEQNTGAILGELYSIQCMAELMPKNK
jgi:hypothetical protein